MNYFLVSSGRLTPDHRRRIGIAVWEFDWLIDHQFKPKNGTPDTGLVLNGEAITAGRIAADLGLSIRTVQRNLETLKCGNYIRTENIPGVGKRYFIAKPKRWKLSTYDRNVAESTQNCLAPHDTNVIPNKVLDSQDYKTTSTPPPPAGEGVSASQKKPSKAEPLFDASTMEIPGWLPQTAWAEFAAHRKEIKKTLTERAAKANIKRLADFRATGQNLQAVIEQTVANGWTGLFQVKARGNTAKAQAPPVDTPDEYELSMREALRAKTAGVK